MSAFTYFAEESARSIWRGRESTLLSIATITAALLTLGGFLLVTANFDRLLARWSAAAEFSIYLHDDISEAQRVELNRALSESPIVASRDYVSKDEALVRFKREFPDLTTTADTVGPNPFPASFDLRLKPQAASAPQVEAFARKVSGMAGVADVRFDRRWLDRLSKAVALVRWGGFVLAAVLIVAAALTVATVVRLALHRRRDEILIMQLVGAPMLHLRGPFIAEGIFQGGVGALLALGILGAAWAAIWARYGAAVASVIDPSTLAFLSLRLCTVIVFGGMVVGCLGGLVAARGVR